MVLIDGTAGHTSYVSRLTGQKHELPAGLGIISGKGSDVMLAELFADFEEWSAAKPSAPHEHRFSKSPEAQQPLLVDEMAY